MSVSKLLSAWRAEPSIAPSIEDWRQIPARPARTLLFPPDLHPALVQALRSQDIQALYTHQASGWEHSRAGKHVMVVTGTASGKSLCYHLPVLDRLLRNPDATALYLFPTKALAQDQAASLDRILEALASFPGSLSPSFSPIPVSVYDGDTPASYRPSIRARARLLISNPDMLHVGILPHHTNWVDFIKNLQFIVVDEAHVYRGVFGSHVANVMRRLKRIAAFYGAHPQFILTSATIANPQEFAGKLIEEDVVLVDDDGAARGMKHFLIYNPPIVNPELGLRRSALQETVRLAEDLLAYNIQTIIFGRSRRSVELILTYLRERPLSPISPPSNSEGNPDKIEGKNIRGYRSGYLPEQRREIEHGLRQGKVRVVIATNALELGVDIGGMGAAILVGYPGSIAATWQQAGRAGRSEAASLAVMVATADPLDQFLASHPDYFFGRSPEHALINPDNLLILLEALRCAAFELPFQAGDSFGRVDGARLAEFLDFLLEQGVLHRSGIKYFWMADQYPAQSTSLRSASASPVILQAWEGDSSTIIGQVDQASAYWMVHPKAVYLHEGQTYVVDALDLEQNVARLRRAEMDYYTIPQSETTVQVLEKKEEVEVAAATKAHGEILVTSQVTGFRKVRWYTNEQLGVEEVSMPSTELLTTGYWLALSDESVERLRAEGLWRNDSNEYGPGWNTLRDRVRARDNYRCQVCSIPEQGRAHDVHHKIPFRFFASREQANQLENLITLCPACHRRAETFVRVRSGLAGLSFVLGQLAPFFLMCDTRDLGVHSDPQSPLTNGQPAVVVYDQVPAGIGFSQRLFELHESLVARAYELVAACGCSDGCPSCVGPGGENGLGGKREALAILSALAGRR